MKTLLVVLIGALICSSGFSQNINFQEGTFEEVLAKAKSENKLVFMDCYTVWCGPCKKLVKEVFPQKEVSAFFNDYFVSLTMDMEKGEGIELAQYYNITAYPTLLFLNARGDIVDRIEGAVNADQLIEKGKAALRPK